MTHNQKQQLPVQFLQFGVDSARVSVPILRAERDSFFRFARAIRLSIPPAKTAPSSR